MATAPIVAPAAFTPEQKADLATLLAAQLPLGNVRAWAATMIGPEPLRSPAVAALAGDPAAHARAVVELLDEAGRMGDALADLRLNGRTGALVLGVQAVIANTRLDALDNHQAFSRRVQPLFASAAFRDMYDRLVRTVCAIGTVPGLNGSGGEILGSGFLVGPDLVMTNAHVLLHALEFDEATGKCQARPGFTPYAFFDYLRPPAPGFAPQPTTCRMVPGKVVEDGWLVYARKPLDYDGDDDVAKCFTNIELDYALIRLDEKVGALPVRKGGGAPRGWLTFPDGDLQLLNDRPLFVFGHPQAAEQSWDMGTLADLDATRSRARYAVSAARGSSGGATVDAEGQLFALHVAEVKPPTLRQNQGVRIDLIVKDLAANGHVKWDDPSSIGRTAADFWSLRDDMPAPIIGRKRFRQAVLDSMRGSGADVTRAFVCRGDTGSGRHFSIALLRRILGPGVPVAQLKPSDLASPAKTVVRLIAAQLNIDDGETPPDPPPTEDVPRWWRTTLPGWLRARLTAAGPFAISAAGSSAISAAHLHNDDGKTSPDPSPTENASRWWRTTLPVWVIVDGVLDDDEAELKWGDGVRETIRAMLDPKGIEGDPVAGMLPELRWLFVGGRKETFPVPRDGKFDELLPDPDTFQRGAYNAASFDAHGFDLDFEECVRVAWWAFRPGDPIPEDLMRPSLCRLARKDAGVHPIVNGARLIADMVTER